MQDTQINTFTGGLDSDSDLRSVADSRYIDASNVDIYSVDSNSRKSISPLKGTTLAISAQSVTSQYQITRVQVDFTGNYTYSFSFYDGTSLKTGSFTTTGANAANRYASFQSLLTTQLNTLGYYVATYSASPSYDYVKFTIGKTVSTPQPFRANISWTIAGVDKEVVVLQEAYLSNQDLAPVASYTIEDHLFVWSETSDESVIELGVATYNISTNTWTYTRLFRTWRWRFPIINPEAIDIRMESVSNDQWAMYITDNYNKPKVFYIPKIYSTDSLLKYTNTDWYIATSGYLIYNYADEQTNLQLVNNAGVVTFSSQLQVGGSLLSGGYRYSVRFGVNGAENTTEWSVLSPNAIPVFKTGIDAPSAYIRIQGDKSGEVTSKCNVLLVQNCMPNVFNYVELAAVYHAETATSATIIGKYPITAKNITITHTGKETGVQKLDATLLPQTEPVIKTAKTLEIKKNRFNIANVSVGADDPALASIASGSTIAAGRYEVEGVGLLAPKVQPYLIGTTSGMQFMGGVIDFQTTLAPISYDIDSGVWTPIISPSSPPYINEVGTYDISFTYKRTESLEDLFQITQMPTQFDFNSHIYSFSFSNGTRTVNISFTVNTFAQLKEQMIDRFRAEGFTVNEFYDNPVSSNFYFTIGKNSTSTLGTTSSAPIAINFTYSIDGVSKKVTVLQNAYNVNDRPKYNILLFQGTTVIHSVPSLQIADYKMNVTIDVSSVDPIYILVSPAAGNTSTAAYFDATLNITKVSSIENDFKDTKAGEYQLPENCANRVGYMLNEKYPIFMRFHYKNGYISSPFYVGRH